MSRIVKASAGSLIVAALLFVICAPGATLADGTATAPTTKPQMSPVQKEVKDMADKSLAKGAKFLLAVQEKDASWGGKYGPAMTALAVKAVVQAGVAPDSPAVKKAIDFIVNSQVKDDPKLNGSFTKLELANYNTAICLSTLVMLNDKKYLPGKPFEEQIKLGLEFLRRCQWDESAGIDKKDPHFGGIGYAPGERPDLSNLGTTGDTLHALQEAGYITKDDPMYQKVVVFLEHCQNREESNNVGTFTVGNDGGFIYSPVPRKANGEGESKAPGGEKGPDGKSKLLSYGSMTYQGFKSYVYSGLSKDDPRVKAAFQWICKNYSLSENPGVGPEGLFYYYHTMARALTANGEARITDAAHVAHDWRAEMVDKLVSIQRDDPTKPEEAGSWINAKASRWEEGNPILATCFAMLAMEELVK